MRNSMFPNWKRICILIVLLTATANFSAQTNFNNIGGEVGKALLKKDLRQAIKEAETTSSNDLRSLMWRLNLYRRAANEEKVALTVRQIIRVSDTEKNRYAIFDHLIYALKDPLFKDTQTLQLYLQFNFNGDIYGRFIELCSQNRQTCNINGFDKWLAQKAQETLETKDEAYYYGNNHYSDWVSRRIDWRRRFGLDNAEILNQFVEDLRKNSADLNAAVLYLRFSERLQDYEWLAQTFASEQAYDYYELGETLSTQTGYRQMPENEQLQIHRIAAQFLQKSLSLPFTKQDIPLMARRYRFASIPPVIKNYEKQLRFWTKTELAEAYKNIGEPQNAQPIVEELMNLDISDIVSYKPSQLAGAVQAGSGARVVESKILNEQAARQDSYEYWQERIAYYHGRKELERVFDAYWQGLSVVPFDLSNERSRGGRLFFIRGFVDFAEDEFEYYADDDPKDLSEQEKLKQSFWRATETFLRSEFEKTRSNIHYSYELSEIITENKFEKLSHEILSQNPELLVNAAKIDLITDMNDLLYVFLQLENVSQEKKDLIAGQILHIAEKKDVKSAWIICEAFKYADGQPNYAVRIVSILVKNLKIAENKFNLSKSSDEDRSELEGLKNKYIEILFGTYLSANDWRSAEKLLMERLSVFFGSPFDRLILNAAKNGAFNDAVRYWKIKANLDRGNLENLASLVRYPAIAESLRKFYKQMKIDEPYSPVPDIALRNLR